MPGYADLIRSSVGQTTFDPNQMPQQATASSPLAALLRGGTLANAQGSISNLLRGGGAQKAFSAQGAGPALMQGAQATMGAVAPNMGAQAGATMAGGGAMGGPLGLAAMLQSGNPTHDMGTSAKLGALGGANLGLGYASLPDSLKNIFKVF